MESQGIIFNKKACNIGDDIQTYAASLLVDNPKFLDRENLHLNGDGNIKTITNGWFMTHDKHWPPAKYINPLFISFHGNKKIINIENKDYYKKFEPIGCRDYDTVNHFKAIGIDAYFSGCITLTLPKINISKTDEIIAIDLLRTNYDQKFREVIINKIIPEDYKSKITFDTHLVNSLEEISIEDRLENVKKRLNRYASAKLVITSLIHCALPCLAIGTPVLFIDLGFSNRGYRRTRFNGILDLMNTCNANDINIPFGTHSRFDKMARSLNINYLFLNSIGQIPVKLLNSPEKNPDDYLEFSSLIKDKVTTFFKHK